MTTLRELVDSVAESNEYVRGRPVAWDDKIEQLVSRGNNAISDIGAMFSMMYELDTPAHITGARRIGGYPYDDATIMDDSMRDDSKLPAIEWSNEAGAYIAAGNPEDIYTGATSDMTTVSATSLDGGESKPCFWGIPKIISHILPNVKRAGINNGYSIKGKIPALILKVDVGLGFTPHTIRRTFIDVVQNRTAQSLPNYHSGSFENPVFSARNVAIDGRKYGDGNYVSTVVVPLKPSSTMDSLRVINNGHVPIDVYAYGFVWMNKIQESV